MKSWFLHLSFNTSSLVGKGLQVFWGSWTLVTVLSGSVDFTGSSLMRRAYLYLLNKSLWHVDLILRQSFCDPILNPTAICAVYFGLFSTNFLRRGIRCFAKKTPASWVASTGLATARALASCGALAVNCSGWFSQTTVCSNFGMLLLLLKLSPGSTSLIYW